MILFLNANYYYLDDCHVNAGYDPCGFHCFVESPAAKTGLLVGDEILEVNGDRVTNFSHTEVILTIHKVSTELL